MTPHTRAAGGSCPPAAYPPISDYSLIGNCRSAALIGRDGAIDWLCWPRFDSNAIFAAILDQGRGGTFRIRPAGDAEIQRRYLPGTAIVETTYRTSGGACVVRDLMPVVDERDKRTMLVPEHEILREIEGLAGEVVIEVEYAPRPGFGLDSLRLVDRHGFGIWCEAGGALYLQSDIPLTISRDGQTASGSAPVQAGQRRYLSLGFSSDGPAVIPPLGNAARERIERAGAWWSAWAGRCQYDGPYREAVVRSAITLKLLTFAPSGAIIAAGSIFAFLLLFAIDLFAHHGNPYMGILAYVVAPAFLFLGLFLIFVGIWLQRRHARLSAPGTVSPLVINLS
ncbi:MAG TPA: DUF5911 domain-containing protein, partial [Thermomicrobiales bacterium]|nr:DUF5911 domain-containing protein [Thermomicrobiales bacterium]